ncbi:MAG: hypothetical protein M3O91_05030 [Chloroflexota bacterium]|nr:hypothetical protein [Chloroflexota bacterium]
MKELLQGRRFGFAPRPHVAQIAVGLGVATTLLDLMAWFAWGSNQTNAFVTAAYWLAIATAVVIALALLGGLAELADVLPGERTLARTDLVAAAGALVVYVASAALRSGDLGAAAASPAAFLLAIAGLPLLLIDGVIAANLYSAREWKELEEELPRDRRPRRRAATR